MSTSLRVLLLAHQPADLERLADALRRAAFDPDWQPVETEADYLAALDRVRPLPDVILADLALPCVADLSSLHSLRSRSLDIPFILLCDPAQEDAAADSIRQGAADYLLKAHLPHLGLAVAQALELKRLREDKRLAETALRESERRFHALIENSSDAIALLSAEGAILYVSPRINHILGYPTQELVGLSVFERVHPDDLSLARAAFAECLQKPGIGVSVQVRYQHQDGDWRWLEGVGTNLLDVPGVQAVVLNYHDISAGKQAAEVLRRSEEKFRLLVENLNEVIYAVDDQGTLTYISPSVQTYLGYMPDELIGHDFKPLIFPEDLPHVIENYIKILAGDPAPLEYRVVDRAGATHWTRGHSRPIWRDGRIVGIQGALSDISEYKQVEEQLRYLGTHDVLTGLHNRTFFEAEVDRLQHGRQFPLSVLMVDVDGLKATNDQQGHAAGDELLRRAAGVLRATFRGEDAVARIGGDEFAMLLPRTASRTSLKAVERLRLSVAADNSAHHDGLLSLSIGVATAENAEQLLEALKQADAHMYQDKSAHRLRPAGA